MNQGQFERLIAAIGRVEAQQAETNRLLQKLVEPPADGEGDGATARTPQDVAADYDYENLTAAVIIQAADDYPAADRAALLAYEQANKARKTVIEALSA